LTPITTVASSGDDHLAGAGLEMLRGRGTRAVTTGGLDHHIDAELTPGQLGKLRLGQRANRMAVDDQLAVGVLHGARERPVDGVVAQQVRERGGAGDVVHRDDLKRRLLFVSGAQDAASDAAKTIDCNSGGHLSVLHARR